MNTDLKVYADVILPFPIPQLFTYAVPKELEQDVVVGKRTIVQFGAKKYYTAILAKIHNIKPTEYIVKEIIAILDAKPIVNQFQLKFWQWISDYYMCSIGEVMKAALPAGLKLESQTIVTYNEHFDKWENLSDPESLLLQLIKNNKVTEVSKVENKASQKNILALIKSLYEKNAINIEESLHGNIKPKTATFVRLTAKATDEDHLNTELDKLKNAKKQLEIVQAYLRLSGVFESGPVHEVPKKILLETTESNTGPLNSLFEKGILESYSKEVNRLSDKIQITKELPILSDEQLEAFNQINAAFEKKDITLLHGVTSSGKTEIFFHLIKKKLELGQQVLYLLPEIAITVQIINRLKTYFGEKIGVYHSKFSDAERVEIYNRLRINSKNNYQVILGVRSSIFLPFTNLGLIIVDEEHESSFKQYDPAPRYNARDSAVVLGKMHNAKILFGTATPSVESYYNAVTGRYALTNLEKRFQNIELPEIRLVNMRAARKKGHVQSHFSSVLINEIERTIEKGKQVILFQNRRGFAPYVECSTCGWVAKCNHCDVTLTYHKQQNHLACHYCGFTRTIPYKCDNCSETAIQTLGFGTEKVEDELSIIIPSARIARMDLDTTRSKHSYEDIISQFELQQIDILIGTQMVTKGLDFARVGLVGILNADNMLNFPDFRAFERSFQLITQVSGRAGRKTDRGLVIIQTSMPEHPIIKYVLDNNFKDMFISELAEREQFKYPPLYRLIQITLKHKKNDSCLSASNNLAAELKAKLGNRVLGPDKPLISKIQNMYLHNIIIKLERDAPLSSIKNFIMNKISKLNSTYKSLVISIDVDPL